VAEVLSTRIAVTAVFLFGSQVSGRAGEYSDVDVAVFTPARESMTWDEELDLALLVATQVAPHIELQFFRPERMEHPRPGGFEREVLEHGKRVA
jgi:predicted nucleotidyltransferase